MTYFKISFSLEPMGKLQPNLAKNILGWRGFKSVQMKVFALPRGDNYKKAKILWRNLFKSLLLQNHWTNFNQTWHNASLGEEDSSLFKRRAILFPWSTSLYQCYDTHMCWLIWTVFSGEQCGPWASVLKWIHLRWRFNLSFLITSCF